ncbi:magnesium protoporphyrin IX methyltransferase [Afifella sp. IM 167]|uniref:magnesium protoporphyrin IX methyltransferase n=1 Tax=Afifella sp. IM 167 TaxID=2033586 RepID=UPI001CCA5E62|nr:magnesium protoporphyrin IX methyltransferase [Afifella sp. IM 167]MBZ8132219.1 magnesium protoporphyrin IX methyltransferase [Afifella sp. IM 167]
MQTASYLERREELETYFDRTAAEAWSRLTSDAPVSRIRATVRAGRDEMRGVLLSYLPQDLTGLRLLDAGCGTGALSLEAARRGAEVVATDLSSSLVALAEERARPHEAAQNIDFRVGDMLDPALGTFDHVVAMDSLIHYKAGDLVDMLTKLSQRSRSGVVFTFAPRTALLSAMHFAGGFFPRSDRAPAIEPIGAKRLRQLVAATPSLAQWRPGRTRRIVSGFYTSQAMELVPA